MAADITITMTRDEIQYLLNCIDTHVKTHGLQVATMGVVIVSKMQAVANHPIDKPNSDVKESKSHAKN